jgi:LPS O-antigen subunit length determinant protein (WzzB/FepE family)
MNNAQNIRNMIDAILRQKNLILGAIVISAVASMAGYKFVPKSYKVQAVIGVQTQYFQSPLVRDFVAETWDAGELRSQREALIRRALNHEFLLDLGKRHHLFGKLKDDEISSYDLDFLSKKFEVVPTGATSFLLGFFSKDPEEGYRIVQEAIAHIRSNMAEERHNTLLRLHDAIQDQLEVLSFGKQDGSTPTIMASRPDLVKVEMERVKAQISVLRRSYSDRHPKVAELNRKLESLQKWLKQPTLEMASTPARSGVFSGTKVDDSAKELFEDLLKKYHYLEVAIYLDAQSQDTYLTILQEPFVPKAPIWPKRPIFLIWGVLAGFLIGSIFALVSEVIQARAVRFRKAAVA